MLDEPTSYLDTAHQVRCWRFPNCMNAGQGLRMFFVPHDLNHAAWCADHLCCCGLVWDRGTRNGGETGTLNLAGILIIVNEIATKVFGAPDMPPN